MNKLSGFTLIELLVMIAILGILLSTAVPAFGELIANTRTATQRDQLLRSLGQARSSAVMDGQSVSLCPRGPTGCADHDHWEQGWLVFFDPNEDENCQDSDNDGLCDADGGRIIRVETILDDSITIRGNHFIKSGLRFDSRGHAYWSNGTISVCHPRTGTAPRGIVISKTGRARTAGAGDNTKCPMS